MWSGVREDERGPADPVHDFRNGARVGGNKVSTGVPSCRPGREGRQGSNRVDSSLIGKRVERPPLLRGNAKSSFNQDLGVSVLAFPHLKPIATAWPGDEGGGYPR